VLATAAVVLLGPWSVSFGTLLWAPVWLMLSALVLREVWRPQPVDADEGPTPIERFRERHPVLGGRIDPRLLLLAAGAVLVAAPFVLDTGPAFVVEAIGASVAVGTLLAWLAGY